MGAAKFPRVSAWGQPNCIRVGRCGAVTVLSDVVGSMRRGDSALGCGWRRAAGRAAAARQLRRRPCGATMWELPAVRRLLRRLRSPSTYGGGSAGQSGRGDAADCPHVGVWAGLGD
jgi:hypothetical protein